MSENPEKIVVDSDLIPEVLLKVIEAKKLLSSGKSVTDTAIMCGFDDYANFIRVFKKHVGQTPGKYRNDE
jgi:AraC-like DNA-binding protein